ncbi:MAG: GAF domain-containing protein [Caldithrix sp.]|nr:GAF domain-containing protein [Caldithrix sp.]
MFTIANIETKDKPDFYHQLNRQVKALFEGERDFLANTANLASLLFYTMPALNWVGFYFYKDNQLVLGPFNGKPACVRIDMGKGVCGTSAANRQTERVDNVHEFPGHIPCDSASNAEIVVPLIDNERLLGVLDIDSPQFSRFDDADARGLQLIVKTLLDCSDLKA